MAGEVDLGDGSGRHGREVARGIEAVVARIDVDVVDVEQQVAIGLDQYRVEEIQLAQLAGQGRIVGHVFDGNPAFEKVLHLTDAIGDMKHRVTGEGHGQQIVEMALITAVAQVFGITPDLVAQQERLDVAQQVEIQRIRGAERQ